MADRTPLGRVVLVRVITGDAKPVADPLAELAALTATAGGAVLGQVVQRRDRVDAATYLGRGKLAELKQLVEAKQIALVIFDNRLSPGQQRNLEKELGCPVIDRTELILKIFAQRARTQEAQLQVELAQLTYLQTRLHGRGKTMSQQVANVGMRGPGEKKLEYDRRYLKLRELDVKRALERVVRSRREQRKSRGGLPFLALVGYTNAGKSALLNALTGASTLVEDQLFATLDPTVRRWRLPDGTTVLLSDTVGFISELPTHLVAAFRATLEEIREADLLLHVIDVAAPGVEARVEEVMRTLKELEVANRPLLSVLNKSDLVPNRIQLHKYRKYPHSVTVSALTGDGLDRLAEKIAELLHRNWLPARVRLPRGLAAGLYEELAARSVITRRESEPETGDELLELTAGPEFLDRLRDRGATVKAGDARREG